MLVTATKKVEATSPEVTEAMAVRYGLQIARRLGYTRVWVEYDAINVVQVVRDAPKGYFPVHLIYEDIKKDSLWFDVFDLFHDR